MCLVRHNRGVESCRSGSTAHGERNHRRCLHIGISEVCSQSALSLCLCSRCLALVGESKRFVHNLICHPLSALEIGRLLPAGGNKSTNIDRCGLACPGSYFRPMPPPQSSQRPSACPPLQQNKKRERRQQRSERARDTAEQNLGEFSVHSG